MDALWIGWPPASGSSPWLPRLHPNGTGSRLSGVKHACLGAPVPSCANCVCPATWHARPGPKGQAAERAQRAHDPGTWWPAFVEKLVAAGKTL